MGTRDADGIGADTIAECAEATAPPHIADIYGEIRHWSAVPMVALIFRHLATHDGVLEETWSALAPLFRAGLVQQPAWRVAGASADAVNLAPVASRARAVIGLDGAAHRQLLDILDAYNRANPVNLLSMLALLERLDDAAPARAIDANVDWTPPAAVAALPPMVAPAEMPVPVRWLLNDLGTGDRSALDPVIPSLYRHFADSPALLALLHVLLAPRFRDGSIEAEMQGLESAMREEARRVAALLAPLPRSSAMPAIRGVLERFTTGLIPQMIVVGHALHRAFSAE